MIFSTRIIETSIASLNINNENRFELKKSFKIKKNYLLQKFDETDLIEIFVENKIKKIHQKQIFQDFVVYFFEFDYERSRIY